jgi:MraZ protein
MFVGSFKYSIDAKGRIALPAKLRKYVSPEANDTFILTRDSAKCIDIYPMDIWKALVDEKLRRLNQFDPKEAMFLRLFLQEAAEDTLDSQSRLLIPKSLIEYAEIKNEVFILGSVNKIEVWNPDVYENYAKENAASYEEIAKDVMKRDE